ncbi:MAG: protease pro-enzyme activation domain-containing protein [Bdellovibrionota bacterium]
MAALAALLIGGSGAVGSGARRVAGHIPKALVSRARHVGRHSSQSHVHLAVSLIPHDMAGLNDLIRGLYDPNDSRFHQFLTPSEFRQRFSPSDAEVAQVVESLQAGGLSVAKVHENNLIIELDGTSGSVENAFQVELHDYQAPDGKVAFAPIGEPLLQGGGADQVMAVNGLNSFSHRHTHKLRSPMALDPNAVSPKASIYSYMTPSKLRTAYNVTSITATGAGETLALFELDGYAASDIAAYAAQFSLTTPTLQNVYVSDGTTTPTGSAGADTDEVCLDIEVAMAMAPGLSKIMVYEGENTDAGVLATYSKIANDNVAKEVSSSWGLAENENTLAAMDSENTIFQQMSTQGQSMFAAAGDSGAYDDYSNGNNMTLEVDDPASQPFVTGVGGTTLTSNVTTGAYTSDSSWGTASDHSGGGGGISTKWAIPAWQAGLGSNTNLGSANFRMVPDVSLDANPNTGYPVYTQGNWYLIGGTSASAPIWAAFVAIVNQGRVSTSQARVGFVNTALYGFGAGGSATTIFHDIADNSTNLHFPAVSGYDLTTGLGTINGVNLYKAFVAPAAPASVTLVSAASSVTVNWTASAGAASYNVYRQPAAGGAYTAIKTGTAALTFVDTTSVGSNNYYVTAVNAAAEGAGSPVATGAASQAPPAAPSALAGTVIK